MLTAATLYSRMQPATGGCGNSDVYKGSAGWSLDGCKGYKGWHINSDKALIDPGYGKRYFPNFINAGCFVKSKAADKGQDILRGQVTIELVKSAQVNRKYR